MNGAGPFRPDWKEVFFAENYEVLACCCRSRMCGFRMVFYMVEKKGEVIRGLFLTTGPSRFSAAKSGIRTLFIQSMTRYKEVYIVLLDMCSNGMINKCLFHFSPRPVSISIIDIVKS